MTSTIGCTSHTHPDHVMISLTSTTSRNTVPNVFLQKPNGNMETPKHKTLNNALVSANEVYSNTWKLNQDHAPSHT